MPDKPKVGRFKAGRFNVKCSHCSGEVFELYHVSINNKAINLPFNTSQLICRNCSLIMWFDYVPEEV